MKITDKSVKQKLNKKQRKTEKSKWGHMLQ